MKQYTLHQEHGHCEGGHHEGCGHHHHHHGEAGAQPDKSLALLEYMTGHNQQHTQELTQLADQLEAGGHGPEAALLREAAKEYEAGNQKLADALGRIKEA